MDRSLTTAEKVIARVAGAILILVALGFAVIPVLIFKLHDRTRSSEWYAIGVFSALACGFFSIGFRLLFDRPNRNGTLLSPFSWYVIGAVFFATGIVLAVATISSSHYAHSAGILGAFLVGFWCIQAGNSVGDKSSRISAETQSIQSSDRRGYAQIFKIWGIPVYMHWSLPYGGLLIAVYAGLDIRDIGYSCIGYVMLILIHEAGHAWAARFFRLKVFAVELSGVGGLCRLSCSQSVTQAAVIYSAGIVAQLLLLFMTLLFTKIFGDPISGFGKCIFAVFTTVNVILIVFNLIPGKVDSSGLSNDGAVLWSLFLHAAYGKPLPEVIVLSSEKSPIFPREVSLLDVSQFVPDGFICGIEVLNDDKTPMQFVVKVLTGYLGMNQSQATKAMLYIHNHGGMIFKTESFERATEIATSISAEASSQGYPFICRAVSRSAKIAEISS